MFGIDRCRWMEIGFLYSEVGQGVGNNPGDVHLPRGRDHVSCLQMTHSYLQCSGLRPTSRLVRLMCKTGLMVKSIDIRGIFVVMTAKDLSTTLPSEGLTQLRGRWRKHMASAQMRSWAKAEACREHIIVSKSEVWEWLMRSPIPEEKAISYFTQQLQSHSVALSRCIRLLQAWMHQGN